MRLTWVTDIHLDFLDGPGLTDFLHTLGAAPADGLLVGGDIADAPSIESRLCVLAEAVPHPLYFVLGNHDFYGGSIPAVRARMDALCARVPSLVYLSHADVISLTETTALIGHDGWGDARYGDYARSTVCLNDHLLIAELTGLDRATLQRTLQRLGDEAAAHLGRVLPAALATHPEVLLLTHVPPFQAACWYQGRTSDDNWAPFFSCRAVGDTLVDIMTAHSDRQLTVLCGHTHSPGRATILPNLTVMTGGAEYGAPALQSAIDIR